MGIAYTIPQTIELARYGKFTLLQVAGAIAAADAVIINANAPPEPSTPAVEGVYEVADDEGVVTERFCWGTDAGGTTLSAKVYYELWTEGYLQYPYINFKGFDTLTQKFYCGGYVRYSSLENMCTHIVASKRVIVKLWNATGASAASVDYDFTVWYYVFKLKDIEKVLGAFWDKGVHNKLDTIAQSLKNIEQLLKK